MAAVEPARERIQRRLQDAVERLRHDMDEVEFWTEVLSGLTRPVPDYSGTNILNRFALPQRGSDAVRMADWGSDRRGEKAKIRQPDGRSNTGNSRH